MRSTFTTSMCAAAVALAASHALVAQSSTLSLAVDKLPAGATVHVTTAGDKLPKASASGTASAGGALSLALDLGNMGKVDVPVTVYTDECNNQEVNVTFTTGGEQPPTNCKRRMVGAFWWTKSHRVTLHYSTGTLSTGGLSTGTKALLVVGGAGAVVTGLVVTHGSSDAGGGATPSPTTSAGTSTPASTPASTPTSSSGVTGTFTGIATLMKTSATCAGEDPEYNETATVNINAAGVGSITFTDNSAFTRMYNGTLINGVFSSQGTFSFLGVPVPGTLTANFSANNTVLNTNELTNWNTCSNVFTSVLNRQ